MPQATSMPAWNTRWARCGKSRPPPIRTSCRRTSRRSSSTASAGCATLPIPSARSKSACRPCAAASTRCTKVLCRRRQAVRCTSPTGQACPAAARCSGAPTGPCGWSDNGVRLHYCYGAGESWRKYWRSSQRGCEGGERRFAFVGFQEPLAEIPAGAVVRISLAHWWRPRDHPEEEERCYLQLSGWFLPSDVQGCDGMSRTRR